jgi:hypothetical protein
MWKTEGSYHILLIISFYSLVVEERCSATCGCEQEPCAGFGCKNACGTKGAGGEASPWEAPLNCCQFIFIKNFHECKI